MSIKKNCSGFNVLIYDDSELDIIDHYDIDDFESHKEIYNNDWDDNYYDNYHEVKFKSKKIRIIKNNHDHLSKKMKKYTS